MHYTATVQTHPPLQVAGTEYYELSDEDVVPARGSRPPCLGEPRGPQERDLQRTVEQIAVYAPTVQILDAPVPQLVEQLPDVLRFFDKFATVPEQVIAVPKIFIESVPPRAFLRATQLAEQLVEVPTIISFSLMSLLQSLLEYRQRTVEQNVDIPAVGGIGTGGGSSGFLPGQISSETAEQIVEIPVPRPHGAGDFQGFSRGQGSTAFAEQIDDFPVSGGGQNFQAVQGSAASSSDLPGQAVEGVFRTFPQNKKSATQPPHSTSALPPHSSPWTPAPYDASMVLEEEEEEEEEEECEEDFAVEYVEYDNCLWGREWDSARQQFCCGWPLPMGHRLVMPSGGRRGSLAEGQDDVPGTTVDTCFASLPVLMPYFSSFYVKVNLDPEVVFLALWRVGVHAEWRSVHSQSFSFPCSHLEFGHYVMSLCVPVPKVHFLGWSSTCPLV